MRSYSGRVIQLEPTGKDTEVAKQGALVKISNELVMTARFVQRAIALLTDADETGITVSAFRERLGTSRKYAVPLLEYLDRTGFTRREGDLRFPRRTQPVEPA